MLSYVGSPAMYYDKGCHEGIYGPNCDSVCPKCENGGICHDITGQCICPPGFMGETCNQTCGDDYFGRYCQRRCSDTNHDKNDKTCKGILICLPDPYGCSCGTGYYGPFCNHSYPLLNDAPTVSDITEKEATVRFSPWRHGIDTGEGNPSQYWVQYKAENETWRTTAVNATLTTYVTVVKELSSYTYYDVRVLVIDEDGMYREHGAKVTRFRPACVAPGDVANVKLLENGSRNATVSWSPPKQKNGVIRSYRVVYRPLEFSIQPCTSLTQLDTTILVSPTHHSQNLTPLRPYTKYLFSVAALTIKYGPQMNATFVTEQASPEGVPTQLHYISISRNTDALTWAEVPCEQRNGPITSYYVEMDSVDPWETKRRHQTVNWTSITYRDLLPHTGYRAKVYAENGAGRSPFFASTNFTTPSAPPPAPGGLDYDLISQDSILLMWKAPYPPAGVLERYQLQYWNANTGYQTTRILNNYMLCSTRNHDLQPCFTVRGLEEDMVYNFTVGAVVHNAVSITLYPVDFEKGPITSYYVLVLREGEAIARPVKLVNYTTSQHMGLGYYVAAHLTPDQLEQPMDFVVGSDNIIVNGGSNSAGVGVVIGASLVLLILIVAAIAMTFYCIRKRRQTIYRSESSTTQSMKEVLSRLSKFDENVGSESLSTLTTDSSGYLTMAVVTHRGLPSKPVSVLRLQEYISHGERSGFLKEEYMVGMPSTIAKGQLHPWDVALKAENKPKNRYEDILPFVLSILIIIISRGTGRTGTLILVDSMASQAESEGEVDLVAHLHKLHQSRINLLESEEQYIFVYKALLEILRSKSHRLTAKEFSTLHQKLKTKSTATGKTAIELEYQGFERRNAYLVTQLPLPETVDDFWEMLAGSGSATLVTLGPLQDETKTANNTSTGPHQGSCLFSSFSALLKRSFEEVLFKLLSDGCQKSGLYCVSAAISDEIKVEQELDVFRAVRNARRSRPQFIVDSEQYTFCYDLALSFVNTFDAYSNFR
ncbi:hypothetical protein MTO96_018765 [Rhipicephalus appendiculatus]